MTGPPTKAEDVLDGLAAGSASRLKSLRALKNAIIGSKKAKLNFIQQNAVQLVLTTLSAETDPAVAVEASACLGSFSAHAEGARAVLRQGGIPILLHSLQSNNSRLVEASVRALKLLFKSGGGISHNDLQAACKSIPRLVEILATLEPPVVAESASIVLAHCCKLPEGQAAVLANSNAASGLVNLLGIPPKTRQAAALEALASLTSSSTSQSEAARNILQHESVVPQLVAVAKQATLPRLRYLACACLVSLAPFINENQQQQVQQQQQRQGPETQKPLSREEVEYAVLPVLVRLLSDDASSSSSSSADAVAQTLTSLIKGRPELQAVAADAHAITKLASLLRDTASATPSSPSAAAAGQGRGAGALAALAVLCADQETHRQQLLDAGALQPIVTALGDSFLPVRAAACSCLRSLSRSTALLRRAIGTSLKHVVAPLLELATTTTSITQPSSSISTISTFSIAADAAATLANLAVEYCTVKDEVMKLNGISKFAELAATGMSGITQSTATTRTPSNMQSTTPTTISTSTSTSTSTITDANAELRLHGIWGLSSIAFLASVPVKRSVIEACDWRIVDALLQDSNSEIRQKTLLLLRNVMHSPRPDNNFLQRWTGGALLPAMLRALQHQNASPREHQHAIYVVVNISSGLQDQKDVIMSVQGLPNAIAAALSHTDAAVREGAVWTFINLCCMDEHPIPGSRVDMRAAVRRRVATLRELNVEERLKQLATEDACASVRERAEVALQHFGGGDVYLRTIGEVEEMTSRQNLDRVAESGGGGGGAAAAAAAADGDGDTTSGAAGGGRLIARMASGRGAPRRHIFTGRFNDSDDSLEAAPGPSTGLQAGGAAAGGSRGARFRGINAGDVGGLPNTAEVNQIYAPDLEWRSAEAEILRQQAAAELPEGVGLNARYWTDGEDDGEGIPGLAEDEEFDLVDDVDDDDDDDDGEDFVF